GTLVRVDDRTASIADVQAGSIVEIEATSDGTTLTAIRIKVERPDDRFVEVNGTVSEITGSLVTVQTKNGPVTVSLTSTTTFRGGSAADLTPGAVVEIMAARNTDGSLVALNVEIDDGRDDVNNDKLIEIQGAIVTIGPSSITLMTRAGKTVVGIDGATAVQNHGKAGTLGDLASGQMVEVKAQRNRDNTLLAKFIKIDD
ncbi:MAG: DUF5666 domain-containing protein, partial [Thermoanaerobaculia bacterium]